MLKRFSALLTILLVFSMLFGTLSVLQAAYAADELNINATSAFLIEADSGKILYQKNENQPLPPASMTKMMTEYLILDAIKSGKISWDDQVSNTEYGFYLAKKGDSSSIGLGEFETRTVRELYEAMSIYSANDATVVLAEHLAGSEANFVKLMNEKAKEFGMENTHFLTSTGYPISDLGPYAPSEDGTQHVMSARDAAILARKLVTTFPEALEFSSVPKRAFRPGEPLEREMVNYNWMLPGLINAYPGVDGLKTGYTDNAGYCFTGTAQRDGVRYISVVMGAGSKLDRFAQTKKLLDYAFNSYHKITAVKKGEMVESAAKVPVQKGVKLSVPAVAEKDFNIPVKNGEEENFTIKTELNTVQAPVTKGQVIGRLTVEYSGEGQAGFATAEDQKQFGVNLVAAEDAKKAGWLRLFFRGFTGLISGIFSAIVHAITGLFS